MIYARRLLFLLPLLFLLAFQFTLISCKKEIVTNTITKTDTLIQTDTIVKVDTTLTTEILSANPWKVQEQRGVRGGSNVYYLRGGVAANNTESLDNEYITFNSNKSGILISNLGLNFSLTWDFDNAEHTKLTWIFYNTPTTYTIHIENLRYKNKSLIYDEYYTDGNTLQNSHSHVVRIIK